MSSKKKTHPDIKERLHPRNKHRERYDFKALIERCPELAHFIIENKYGDETVDFFNPQAVKALNKALLLHYYNLDFWDIPDNYLCPPVPGRADYIHYMADLLSRSNHGRIPQGSDITCLDIGVGANAIYPIIGNGEYGWSFIGSDIDPIAIASAEKIIASNPKLAPHIACRLQRDPAHTFSGILKKGEMIDLTICNPPFHSSIEEAHDGNLRKVRNLKNKKVSKPQLNFGGNSLELATAGGEKRFIVDMVKQSAAFAKSCCWFSTLVSKNSHLDPIYDALDEVAVQEYETIDMGQGNKISRIVAWTFLDLEEEKAWAKTRWNKKN